MRGRPRGFDASAAAALMVRVDRALGEQQIASDGIRALVELKAMLAAAAQEAKRRAPRTSPVDREHTRRFGALFRSLRKRAGLSQVEVANRIGLSSVTVCNIEHGRGHPPIGRWRAWARALRLDRDQTRALRQTLPARAK